MRFVLISSNYAVFEMSEKEKEQLKNFLESTSYYNEVIPNVLKVGDPMTMEVFYDKYFSYEGEETSEIIVFSGDYEICDVKSAKEFKTYCSMHDLEYVFYPTPNPYLYVRKPI